MNKIYKLSLKYKLNTKMKQSTTELAESTGEELSEEKLNEIQNDLKRIEEKLDRNYQLMLGLVAGKTNQKG